MLDTSLPNQEEKGGASNGLSFNDLEKAEIYLSFKSYIKGDSECGGAGCHSKTTIPVFFREPKDSTISVFSWCEGCVRAHTYEFCRLTEKDVFTLKVLRGL